MIGRFNFNCLGEFLTVVYQLIASDGEMYIAYIASSNRFSVKALLPSAFSASAILGI